MATLSGSRIRHTVAFALSKDLDDQGTEAFLAALRSLAGIDGVEEFEVVRQVGAKNDYDHGVVMEFADRAAYDAYNGHPDHVAFVERHWDTAVADFVEIDFAVLD